MGDLVGAREGGNVGDFVGIRVGCVVGEVVGASVGDRVGAMVMTISGPVVGDLVGSGASDTGDTVGGMLGDFVGEFDVGLAVREMSLSGELVGDGSRVVIGICVGTGMVAEELAFVRDVDGSTEMSSAEEMSREVLTPDSSFGKTSLDVSVRFGLFLLTPTTATVNTRTKSPKTAAIHHRQRRCRCRKTS